MANNGVRKVIVRRKKEAPMSAEQDGNPLVIIDNKPYYCRTCGKRAMRVLRCPDDGCYFLGCPICIKNHEPVSMDDIKPIES